MFKRFILIKKQLECRRLLHICFNALKPNTKEKFGDVRNVRVSVRILADALVKMKNGTFQPEERIIQALDYERKEMYRGEHKRRTDDEAPIVYDNYMPRRKDYDAMFKLTVTQQRLQVINRAFDDWMSTRDSLVWDVLTYMLSDSKTKRRDKFKRTIKSLVDPLKCRLEEARELLGSVVN